MPGSMTYGFGAREGRHLNALCDSLLSFADEHDIALPELLGYMDMAKDAFLEAMLRPGFDSEDRPPEFPEEGD